MSVIFKTRSPLLERMDVETWDAAAIAPVLRNLETINHWLGGVRATLWHFRRFAKRWKPGAVVRVLDWGTGGADVPRALAAWGRRRGFDLRVTGLDQDAAIVEYARAACAAYPGIRIVQTKAENFQASAGSFDYAMSSLTLHHLADGAIADLLRASDRLARRGIVMNDLRRSARAWVWIWLLSRAARCHPMVRHDGPLSVRRAFTAAELAALAQKAGASYLRVHAHFGHRLVLAGEKA